MSNIRFKFLRGEEVKFISHLDLMKVFERALRRSRIPIAYSQGFNPHPQMVFGLPLSVGVTSEAEYADFEMSRDYETDEFATVLNSQLPAGLKIVEAKLKNNKRNIMASIMMAAYDILIYSKAVEEQAEMERRLDEFCAREEIVVKKEGKNGSKDVDIKPMIRKIGLKSINSEDVAERKGLSKPERIFCISALLSAGSAANLKPELLVAALNGAGFEISSIGINRTGLFVECNGEIIDPLDDNALSG